MFETPFTVVGNVITDPVLRRVGDQQVYKFRVASNSRRRTAEGQWEPGNSLYVSVNCWDAGRHEADLAKRGQRRRVGRLRRRKGTAHVGMRGAAPDGAVGTADVHA